jgi:hypothetical protein
MRAGGHRRGLQEASILSAAVTAFAALLLVLLPAPAAAADLSTRTVVNFDRYVRLTESRLDRGAFLWIDTLPASQQQARRDELRRNALIIEKQKTLDAGSEIDVPDGLVHHWLGLAFVPGATIDQALALLQDYNAHAQIYRPVVARSRLVARNGDTFRFYLRFVMKKVITVVVNSEHEARFSRPGPDRAEGRIHSTRIAEVENPDTPGERELPVGHDSGYLWRLNTYWRLLARDGGVYLQCESISLTRGIPMGLGWVVGPFVTSIPRESLTFTLETTRDRLAKRDK